MRHSVCVYISFIMWICSKGQDVVCMQVSFLSVWAFDSRPYDTWDSRKSKCLDGEFICWTVEDHMFGCLITLTCGWLKDQMPI